MSELRPAFFLESDHLAGGLYVKETRPAEETRLATRILMVHGAMHGWWAYRKWLSFFAISGWRTYAMSLRNHSGSREVPDETYVRLTVEDYAEDVVDVAAWIGAPVVLMGHSMGGIVVQKAAERIRPRALVLLAPVGPGQLGAIREPLPTDAPFVFSREEARELWFHEIEDEAFQAVYAGLVPESPSVMNQYSSGELRIARESIECPILVVGAEHDRTVVHDFRAIADFYGCDRLLVPEAGHDLMLEKAALDAAIRINHWLLGALSDEGLPMCPRKSG